MPSAMSKDQRPTPKDVPNDPATLLAAARVGDRRALARIVTMLEQGGADTPAMMRAMQPHFGTSRVVGITGPPGAGKSTLVDALIRIARSGGATVGVIAVDPSSPLSGGAILGDRVRMTAALDDDGVYVRSLSSAGHLGGLSPAAVRIVDVLDAAGFDLVLLETVGTGQNEVDVAEVADVRVVVTAPGLGDGIQAMKAGLLEIADVLVVNKADRPGADATLEQLRAAAGLADGGRDMPALKVSALDGSGVEALYGTIESLAAAAAAEPIAARRRRRARYLVARAAASLIVEEIRRGNDAGLASLTDAVLDGSVSPEAAARRILAGG